MMAEQLSGVAIVIFIALGALLLILLFLFAKRQIMRFSLRSRRGPHIPVGCDAPRLLRKEMDRRLDCIARIKYEPQLISSNGTGSNDYRNPANKTSYFYRQKAMDDVKILEKELLVSDSKSCRYPGDSLRAFLVSQVSNILSQCQLEEVHEFCDAYEKARYSPSDFGIQEYTTYKNLADGFIAKTKNIGLNKSKASPAMKFSKPQKKER